MRTHFVYLLAAGIALTLAAGCSGTSSQGGSAQAASAPDAIAASTSKPAPRGMSTMNSGSASGSLSATATIGEKIFVLGRTSDGKVKFTGGSDDVGNGACANCHGDQAQGGDGPMIAWSMLSAKSSAMKNMPKFTYSSADQVYSAVTMGVRPDGTRLKQDMPRYDLSRADFDQLMDFLKSK